MVERGERKWKSVKEALVILFKLKKHEPKVLKNKVND